jgi:hypothetical protein
MEQINKKLTPAEKRLFSEHIIHEYKAKQDTFHHAYDSLHKQLKKFIHFNIAIGLLACAGIVYLRGWGTLLYIFLWSIIWITITSTFLTALLRRK